MRVSAQNLDFHVHHNPETKTTTISINVYGKECILSRKIMGLSECFDLINLFDSQSLQNLHDNAIQRI